MSNFISPHKTYKLCHFDPPGAERNLNALHKVNAWLGAGRISSLLVPRRDDTEEEADLICHVK